VPGRDVYIPRDGVWRSTNWVHTAVSVASILYLYRGNVSVRHMCVCVSVCVCVTYPVVVRLWCALAVDCCRGCFLAWVDRRGGGGANTNYRFRITPTRCFTEHDSLLFFSEWTLALTRREEYASWSFYVYTPRNPPPEPKQTRSIVNVDFFSPSVYAPTHPIRRFENRRKKAPWRLYIYIFYTLRTLEF